MDLDTFLNDGQAQSRAGALTNVASSLECVEELRQILRRNADPTVPNVEHSIATLALHNQVHGFSRVGVLHGIREEVKDDLPQETFVSPGGPAQSSTGELDGTCAASGRSDFVREQSAETRQIQGHGLAT